jgi:WD40 repeat protein
MLLLLLSNASPIFLDLHGIPLAQAIEEIILCATIPSPEVYATVSEALRRVSVPSHTDAATDVAWIPETNLAVSAALDGTIKVWDTEYGENISCVAYKAGRIT